MEKVSFSILDDSNRRRFLEKYGENLVFLDKNNKEIKPGVWAVYSERNGDQFSYADALGVILKDDKDFFIFDRRVGNLDSEYKETSRHEEDPSILYHDLEMYKKENYLEVHVLDLEVVQVFEGDDLIEFMNKKLPLID